jgi:hypothetical protein
MNDLLQVAVNAHGGLEWWNQLKTVKASVSITGAIWQLKGKPDVQESASRHVGSEAIGCSHTRCILFGLRTNEELALGGSRSSIAIPQRDPLDITLATGLEIRPAWPSL